MKRLFFVIGFLSLISISCKKSKQLNKVCFTRTLTELKIENNTNKKIHFAAFGHNILPYILWIKNCADTIDNSLDAQSSRFISLSSLSGYSNNDLVVVFWWECYGNIPAQDQNVVLERNQSECR
jgi:hypothetical protein